MTNSVSQGDTSPSKSQNISNSPSENDIIQGDVTRFLYETSGVLKMASATRCFHDLVTLNRLDKIQRLYRLKDPAILNIAPSFPACCELIGVNYSSIKEHLSNIHLFGLEVMERFEEFDIPIRDIRNVKKLPEDTRKVAIEMIMQGGKDPEMVRTVIRDLVEENVRLKDITDEAAMTEKVDLIDQRDKAELRAQLNRDYLDESNEKLNHWKAKYYQLYDSRKPEERVKAMQVLADEMAAIIKVMKEVGEIDDPIYRSEKDRLLTLVYEFTDHLK